jgi:hypothetical protein
MAHWCKLAGLPKGLTLHGLRKSLGVYLAEAEASTRQLMDVLGHDDIDHAELYSREASQVRLAVQGMDRVVRLVTRKPLLGEPVGEPRGEPPHKALINNDNGGPGGRIQTIDFIVFFVGLNQISSRIIPYGSAACHGPKSPATSRSATHINNQWPKPVIPVRRKEHGPLAEADRNSRSRGCCV